MHVCVQCVHTYISMFHMPEHALRAYISMYVLFNAFVHRYKVAVSMPSVPK